MIRRSKKKNRTNKCYNCGAHGHITTMCSNDEIKISHQNDHPNEKPREACMQRNCPSFWYNSPFYGYFFSCNDFGHRDIDCRAHERNKIWFNTRCQAIPQFLGHIRCFLCDDVGHKAKDWKLPMCYKWSIQKKENMQGQPHKKKKDQNMKFCWRKEKQGSPTKNWGTHGLRGSILLHYELHANSYFCSHMRKSIRRKIFISRDACVQGESLFPVFSIFLFKFVLVGETMYIFW